MTWDLRIGDCFDPLTGLASLPDKSIDAVITDPPYGAQVYSGYRTGEGGGRSGAVKAMNIGEIGDSEIAAIAPHFARLAKRWVVVWCDAELIHAWRIGLQAVGLEYIRAGVWIRPNAAPQFTGDRPAQGFESCVIAHPKGKKRWNGGGTPAVWTAPVVHGPERRGHPCPKPLSLMETQVRLFSDPGEVVLDPFAGSGTTGAAAIHMGRDFIGWERDPKHHAAAVKRLQFAREQMALFGGAA